MPKNQLFNNRITLINYCISRFSFTRYLEIGCNKDGTFSNVRAQYKVGVDPIKGGTIRLSSDEYFSSCRESFDIIFIDGLHHCEQVVRDIEHALQHLSSEGIIVLHDCNPVSENHQLREPSSLTWNGDVWKAFVYFRQDLLLDMVVANFDHGIGLIRKRKNKSAITLSKPYANLGWSDLENNRVQWLRLMSPDEIANWL